MFPYATRIELERLARLVGYEPEGEDTDADLILAVSLRGGSDGGNEQTLASPTRARAGCPTARPNSPRG
jgi:hypothetical protein